MVEVPFFQRAYVWKEDLWDRFLDDMEYVAESNKTHFLGSIILKEGKKPEKGANYTSRYTIIDGQQRITTFLIFLNASMAASFSAPPTEDCPVDSSQS